MFLRVSFSDQGTAGKRLFHQAGGRFGAGIPISAGIAISHDVCEK
jgi:hypothetical protein